MADKPLLPLLCPFCGQDAWASGDTELPDMLVRLNDSETSAERFACVICEREFWVELAELRRWRMEVFDTSH